MREQPNMHITPLDVNAPVAGCAVRVSNCAVSCQASTSVAGTSLGATVARGEKGCERLRLPDSRLDGLAYGTCAQREAHSGRFVALATRRSYADEDNRRSQLEFQKMRATQLRELTDATSDLPYEAFGTHTSAPLPSLS
jgi:hypothetical protein